MDYDKCELNPVLTGKDLPEGGSTVDFRDPKIWRAEGRADAPSGSGPGSSRVPSAWVPTRWNRGDTDCQDLHSGKTGVLTPKAARSKNKGRKAIGSRSQRRKSQVFRCPQCMGPHSRALKMATDAAHKAGIWIGICGELGADLTLLPTFLAMDLDELSVSPARSAGAGRRSPPPGGPSPWPAQWPPGCPV